MRLSTKVFLFSLCLPNICNASSFNGDEQEDQSIPVAGFLLTPFLVLKQGYDSNVVSSKEDKINSWFTIFQPNIKLTRDFGEFGKNNIELDWIFTHGAYHASGDDSYNDHDVSGKINYELNQRHRLMFQGGYLDSHEERGARFSIGTGNILEEPDTFQQFYGGIQYSFGALEADNRLELEAGYLDNDYRSVFTESALTGQLFNNTATRDRKTTEFGGTFYHKVGSVTDLTVEAWATDINYDFTEKPSEELSGNEYRVLVGAEWEATALTSGFAKIGYKQKEFDNTLFDSVNHIEWEAEIKWEPKTYSNFTFNTGRTTEETNGEGFFLETGEGQGFFIKNTQYSVAWSHKWQDRLNSKVTYAINKDVYVGQSSNIREDNNTLVNLALNYDMSYWVSYSLNYVYTERDSTSNFLIFDRELISLNVRLALY